MTFQDLVSGGADCGPGNSLAGFAKQLSAYRSFDQDRFLDSPEANMNYKGKQRAWPITPENELAEEFFRENQMSSGGGRLGQQRPDMFEFGPIKSELSAIPLQPPEMLARHPHHADWAADFAEQQSRHGHQDILANESYSDFEAAFAQARAITSVADKSWTNEFGTFQAPQSDSRVANFESDFEFERAFDEAKKNASWAEEFATQESGTNWAEEFEKSVNIEGDPKEVLAKTAGLLLDSVEASANPKFKSSKFMGFMKQLRDQEVSIEGNKVIQSIPSVAQLPSSASIAAEWAKEFGGSENIALGWEEEFEDRGMSWADEFEHRAASLQHQRPAVWVSEFEDVAAKSSQQAGLDQAFDEVFGSAWNKAGSPPMQVKEEGISQAWENPPLEYQFMPNNPYLSKPMDFLENPLAHRNLAESILALEAAVQLKPDNAVAWQNLGLKQQENENDNAAIAALRKSVKIDPGRLQSWMGLSVSYTNEGDYREAHHALRSWLQQNSEYSHLAPSTLDDNPQETLTRAFMAAARMRAGDDMDASVQMGLGVLFNISAEYEKAVDCFEASLSKHPQDYMLWNKLGATLANSNNAARAVDAYRNALAINPVFARARYNLGIAFTHLGNYKEAAENLLAALAAQDSVTRSASTPSSPMHGIHTMQSLSSDNIWLALRSVMESYMNRPDLVQAAEHRDLNAFKSEFAF